MRMVGVMACNRLQTNYYIVHTISCSSVVVMQFMCLLLNIMHLGMNYRLKYVSLKCSVNIQKKKSSPVMRLNKV